MEVHVIGTLDRLCVSFQQHHRRSSQLIIPSLWCHQKSHLKKINRFLRIFTTFVLFYKFIRRASGGASRCCYGEDLFLIYAGDSEHGSFSSRAHFEGSYPHAEPGRVPLLSHWLHDLLPHLMCCDWTSDSDSCLLRFMASRPTRDCSVYHSPGLCEFLFFTNKDLLCC